MRHYDPEIAIQVLKVVAPENYERILRAVLVRCYDAGYTAGKFMGPFLDEQARLASGRLRNEADRERLGALNQLLRVPLEEHFAASMPLTRAALDVDRGAHPSQLTQVIREEEALWVAAGGRSEEDYEYQLNYRTPPSRTRDEVLEENATLRNIIRSIQLLVVDVSVFPETPNAITQ